MIGAYFYENEDSTKKYILPNHALKTKYKDAYKCCSCNESLILCKGEKNIHHFRHCKDTTCIRYDKPHLQTKRRLHEEAKLQLQSWIEQERVIRIKKQCGCCKQDEYECYTTPFDIFTKVVLEHRYTFNERNIFYDVAHLNHENKIIEAFEIVYTHKTDEENRPDDVKWFEISAEEIMKKAMEHFEDNYEIVLNNEREYTCEKCVIQSKEKKIRDDIREEEIRCMRQEQELKKQRDDEAIKIVNFNKELLKNEYIIIINRFLDGESNDNSLYKTDYLYKDLFDIEQNRRNNIAKQNKERELRQKEAIILKEKEQQELDKIDSLIDKDFKLLLISKNYKNIINYILDKTEQGIDVGQVVNIIDDKFHQMYLIEKNRRKEVKKIETDKQYEITKAKNLLITKAEWDKRYDDKITKLLEERYDILIKEHQIKEYLKNKN